MPDQDNPPPRRDWGDPATAVAAVIAISGLVLILLDGLDSVLFGTEITFGQWPYLLMGIVGIWFFGVRLFRIGGE